MESKLPRGAALIAHGALRERELALDAIAQMIKATQDRAPAPLGDDATDAEREANAREHEIIKTITVAAFGKVLETLGGGAHLPNEIRVKVRDARGAEREVALTAAERAQQA